MGNSLTSRIYIKSTVDPKNLKFGTMISWVNTIVQKKTTVAIATSLDEIDFSARITQRVYTTHSLPNKWKEHIYIQDSPNCFGNGNQK